jgi:hypothetical protein
MKKREKLQNMEPYDLLNELNKSIMYQDEYVCLIEHLRGEKIWDDATEMRCRYTTRYGASYKDCERCIQAWLNEEVET